MNKPPKTAAQSAAARRLRSVDGNLNEMTFAERDCEIGFVFMDFVFAGSKSGAAPTTENTGVAVPSRWRESERQAVFMECACGNTCDSG